MVVIQCIVNEKEESRQRAIPLFVATDNQIVSFKGFFMRQRHYLDLLFHVK